MLQQAGMAHRHSVSAKHTAAWRCCGLPRGVMPFSNAWAARPGAQRASAQPEHRQFRGGLNEPHTDVEGQTPRTVGESAMMLAALSLVTCAAPAHADALASNPLTTPGLNNSAYVTLALFLMCVPGIWSQIKRAPKANKKRKVYEVPGPGAPGAAPLKERARAIMTYFKKYNYEVKEMGEVITFAGLYRADRGQAAAVTFYTFVGMGSVALVLSLLVPAVGNWWYLLTLAAPAAWVYYFKKGERVEEVRVKMATSDDELTTDITIEGDIEEIERFRKELDLVEKGMVRVKGILEA